MSGRRSTTLRTTVQNQVFAKMLTRERTIWARTDTIRYEYSSIHNCRYRYEYSVRWCPSHRSLRERSLYALGGTYRPLATQTCALSQFYDWLTCRNVRVSDSWLLLSLSAGGGSAAWWWPRPVLRGLCVTGMPPGIRLQSLSASLPSNPFPYRGP